MPSADQLAIADVQRQLDELRKETHGNFDTVVAYIRKTRLQLTTVERDRAVARLRQPTSLLNWTPRQGQATDPNITSSLIDRLKTGSAVADTLGNADPVPGQANLLADPAFEQVTYLDAILTTTTQAIGHAPGGGPDFGGGVGSGSPPTSGAWLGRITAGTVATVLAGLDSTRTAGGQGNPFNSGALHVEITPTGAGTHEAQIDSSGIVISNVPPSSYLVAAVKCARMLPETLTNITSRTLSIEVLDVTSNVARASRSYDLTLLSDTALDEFQAFVALDYNALSAPNKTHQYGIRIRLTVVSTAGTGDVDYWFGEPQLHWSRSPDPVTYAPLVADWIPTGLSDLARSSPVNMVQGKLGGSRFTQIALTNNGLIKFGPGNATFDTRITRSADNLDPSGFARIVNDSGSGGSGGIETVGASSRGKPANAGEGRLYYNSASRSWHGVDESGNDTDLGHDPGGTPMNLAIGYLSPGVPSSVSRTDNGNTIRSTVINYSGAQISSVVTTMFGHTITVVPTYTGSDITAISRTVV